jgi:hypothetical protein
MTILDLQTLIIERIGAYDSDIDTSSGSLADQKIIQPLLRRIGTDPFSVDALTFIRQRLLDEYPDQALQDGDALSDLVVNMNAVLLEPLIREIDRIRNQQSFADPSILTLDEAAALGANLFSEVDRGQVAFGVARIYFGTPQDCPLTPVNYFRSRAGLRFFLTENQSIRQEQMVLNVESNLYYFDVTVKAEAPGEQYNIDAGELVSIAATVSAARVTNKRRFRFGVSADDSVSFVGRVAQELGEKSLVTSRGIIAQVPKTFPEVSRIAVVGFNDPEMQRDILRGGSAGPVRAGDSNGQVRADGEGRSLSRRLYVPDADFTALIGPVGLSRGFVMTVINAFGSSSPPPVRDLHVRAIIDPNTVDFEEQVMLAGTVDVPWALRKIELVLSGIPGGILYPNTTNGTITVPPDQVHIGGMTDVYLRGGTSDGGDLTLDSLTDENPSLSGIACECINSTGQVVLRDLLLGTNYAANDPTYDILETARVKQLTLQILNGPSGLPGAYRIVEVTQIDGSHPVVRVTPVPLVVSGDYRWRLLDIIDVELADPKELKAAGSDMQTIQNADFVSTASGVDFDALGVGAGDVLRILNGADAGDYKVKTVLTPFYTRIQLDRKLAYSMSGVSYKIFRPNTDGGILLPLLRINALKLLDTSGQPTGATIPYALPVDAQSTAFSNPARGVKWEVRDARLGLVSKTSLGAGVDRTLLDGGSLSFSLVGYGVRTVGFTLPGPGTISLPDLVALIAAVFAYPNGCVAVSDYPGGAPLAFGILPTPRDEGVYLYGGSPTVIAALFDGSPVGVLSTESISSTYVEEHGGWSNVHPLIDPVLDVLDVLEGYQIGHYANLTPSATDLRQLITTRNFSPEINRLVRVGARSLGAARMFFLEPTTIEIDDATRFKAELSNGNIVEFKPDPTLSYQKIPALPNGSPVKDGTVAAFDSYLESLSTDFLRYGVREGDILTITYQPVRGTAALPDPVVGLVARRLTLSLADGSNKDVIFVRDSSSIASNAVTRAGVASQINQTVGQTVCSIVQDGLNYYLEFDASISVVIRAASTANTLLGFDTLVDTDNSAACAGSYTVLTADVNRVYALMTPTAAASRLHFNITRPGAQRIVATAMAKNVAETGLYYFDVELVSEGTGDLWNIPASIQLSPRAFTSDGYWLTTPDTALTFSASERPVLHVSRSILEVGVNDDPASATQLAGQKVQVSYDYSATTENVGSFLRTDDTRVINNNPLSRHLIPHYVRLDMTYQGPVTEAQLLTAIQTYVDEALPTIAFEASDIAAIASKRGATSITLPLTLLAVVHDVDRSVWCTRSQNQLNIGRLAAFVPDVITVRRAG